jgi:Kelch motif
MPGRDLPDLEERLRRLPTALAVEAPAGLAERVARQGGRRRRLRRVTAAALVVAVVGVAVATRSAVLDDTPTPVLGPFWLGQDAAPRQLVRGRWQELPSLPAGLLARRNDAVVVWTGKKLIVWGGASQRGTEFRTLADGAVYDPRTRRWEPLPPAPESQWLMDNGLAVWTGREVLVWGGYTIADPEGQPNLGRPADGVAYDPERRTWRRLPPRPERLRMVGSDRWAVWTGRELVAGTVQEAGAGGGTFAVAYDPAANRWRPLPPSPTLTPGGSGHLQARTAMWAGNRLLVWNFWSRTARDLFNESGAEDHPNEEPDGIDLWAYDPATGRWTVLPAPPSQVRRVANGSEMMATGQEVVIASVRVENIGGRDRPTGVAGRYHPDRARWTPIAPQPGPYGEVDLAWTGAALVDPSENAVYDPATDRWLRLPAVPEPAARRPSRSTGAERALLRMEGRTTGAIDVYLLVPARR